MTGPAPVKRYSGWWLVLVGLIIALVGVGVIVGLSLAHVTLHGGRGPSALLLSVPVGVALMIIGIVSVVRRKPLVDDTARHQQFRLQNRALMRAQRAERRARRSGRIR